MRRNISIKTKERLLKTYVFSTLTYGAEAWTLNKEIERRIDACENYCYRRMLKISWMDKNQQQQFTKNNAEKPIGAVKHKIKERKTKFAGHILRRPEGTLLKDVMEGTVEGARGRGRPRIMWMDNIMEWLNVTSLEAIQELAANRKTFRI
uniref:Endonuclease-reverse transcriptase n=1 Tax=Cacopsylla melanoneura TaxID=428564 RepID=A0A8D8U7I3_9HEMI